MIPWIDESTRDHLAMGSRELWTRQHTVVVVGVIELQQGL